MCNLLVSWEVLKGGFADYLLEMFLEGVPSLVGFIKLAGLVG